MGFPVLPTEPTVIPPFTHHVGVVIGWGSKEQMSRIYTQPNVTTVANPKAVGDRSVMELIRKAVSQIGLTLARKGTIAAIASPACPQPTSILLIGSGNITPKDLFRRAGATLVMTVNEPQWFTTRPTAASVGLPGRGCGRATATFTEFRATKVEGKLNWGCYTGHISAPYPSANRARGVHSAAWIRHAQYTSPHSN